MIIRVSRFNSYFWLGLLAVLAFGPGCQSTEKKNPRAMATMRIHLEAIDPRMEHSIAPVYRAQPINISIEKSPFLTELNVADARVTESQGVLAVAIQLERKGTWILENYTSANPGRHYAIYVAWGKKGAVGGDSRWLAAPIISVRITDGLLAFTPDATKEECEDIVAGLRNVAKDEGNLPKEQKK